MVSLNYDQLLVDPWTHSDFGNIIFHKFLCKDFFNAYTASDLLAFTT